MDCSVNQTLKLNKYLVSIIKIDIKRVRVIKFAQYYKSLASVFANLCFIEVIAAYSS